MAKKETKKTTPVQVAVSEREKALKDTLSNIEKEFGKGSVMKLGDGQKIKNIEVISTGSISIDVALGVGGLPKGRIIEMYGPESSGKTTVALHCVAQAQKAGGICSFIDAEHALDPVYAKALGVNTEELYVSQPDDGEQALEIAEAMVRSGAIDLIVIDSVAALVPRAEIEGTMGDSHVGLQARLMSQGLRKITGLASKTNCTIIFINQLREKIGVTYGNPEVTTGGRALKFYSSVRIEIRRGEAIKQGTDVIGNRTKAKIAKNKVAPPFKVAEFDIMYGTGMSLVGDIVDQGADLDIIHKGGSWYSYGDEKLGQGRENAKSYLTDRPWMMREIENKVREHHGMSLLPEIEVTEVVAEKKETEPVEEEINIEDELDIDLSDDILDDDISQ
ncbi:MAG: recombinase RecA [Lachnospirales bacterium]